jgi:hypothetical protein
MAFFQCNRTTLSGFSPQKDIFAQLQRYRSRICRCFHWFYSVFIYQGTANDHRSRSIAVRIAWNNSHGMPLLRLWALYNWARVEKRRRNMTMNELLTYLRDEIRKQVLANERV